MWTAGGAGAAVGGLSVGGLSEEGKTGVGDLADDRGDLAADCLSPSGAGDLAEDWLSTPFVGDLSADCPPPSCARAFSVCSRARIGESVQRACMTHTASGSCTRKQTAAERTDTAHKTGSRKQHRGLAPRV